LRSKDIDNLFFGAILDKLEDSPQAQSNQSTPSFGKEPVPYWIREGLGWI